MNTRGATGGKKVLHRATGAAGRRLRSLRPRPRDLRADAIGSLPVAVGAVPDGMAASVLAGVNPVYGLYANFAGTFAGGLSTRTKLMVVNTTSAAALAAGSALQGMNPADRPGALFLLTLLAGAAMIIAGLLRLGRYTRFVSHSVMIGFLTGIAVNIICGQIPDLTGASAEGPFALAKALDVLTHPARIDVPSLLTGLAALAIIVGLARTRWPVAGTPLALAVPTAGVILFSAGSVEQVADMGEIPDGFPLPHLPEFDQLSFSLVTGALAIMVIVLVQGAGVAEAAPNTDGTPPDPNRDFVAQGVGNLAAGLFRGLPVGGSVGQTSLMVASGGRTRWGPMLAGVWMLLILVLFSGLVGKVAMPTLGAVLIFAGASALRTGQIVTIMRTGMTARIGIVVTFTATLVLPVAAAVGIGVALSLLMQVNKEAMDLKVVELVPDGERTWTERPAPHELTGHPVTVLDVYGSLLYAGARTLRARLPDPAGAESPVVILRLRGRTSLGATFGHVTADYARTLAAVGGRLYLSGLDGDMAELLRRTGRLDVAGPIRTFEATDKVGESTWAAYAAAEAWAVSHRDG
ncbi:SulP family inorganic anion transporter [Streptomyces sp. A7024]|uniref:SulP family inorganic anion transporter n=1 Tax=Streptomyces coryli TaxID=1128680 RepID=A0A6G4TRL6_9ACTN|nr:SulP family inorganic anion transporter [Streptomyces coryli]NGN62635.1 SulP family inorganic anion transporter [Streptomyces coryli]